MMMKPAFEIEFEALADDTFRRTYGVEPTTTAEARAFTERTGLQPTSKERHMLSVGISPAFIVDKLHGTAGDDMEKAIRLRQRVEALVAWRQVYLGDAGAYPISNPHVEIESDD